MFICKNCLENNYKNTWFNINLSFGKCEVCDKNSECDDYNHEILVKKDSLNIK